MTFAVPEKGKIILFSISHFRCPKSNRVKRYQDWGFGRQNGFFAVKCGPCFLYIIKNTTEEWF